jgi:hypothetical protein
LAHAGAVDEPAQDQHGLPETAQHPASAPGADLGPAVAQEAGQVLGGGDRCTSSTAVYVTLVGT